MHWRHGHKLAVDKIMRPAYQLPIGRSRLVCRGKILLGGDYPKAGLTFTLITAVGALQLAGPCRFYLLDYESQLPMCVCSVLLALSLVLLGVTATCDPGVLPKQRDGFSQGPRNTSTLQSQSLDYTGPTQTINITGTLNTLKYCEECKT